MDTSDRSKDEHLAKVMETAVSAGQIMLENGAEIFRVEETMERIACHFGVDSGNFFVLSNGILTSGGTSYSNVRYIPFKGTRLEKVALVNDLSRRIGKGACSLEEASVELERIRNLKAKPDWEQVLASGIGSAAFCAIFGGSLADCLASLVAGILLYIVILRVLPARMSKITANILCSMFVTALCVIFMQIGFGRGMGNMIIGAIIPLIPGVAFTNGIRDLANQDYIAGFTRLLDAMMVFFSIAAGVAITFLAASRLGVELVQPDVMKTDALTAVWPVQIAAALLGTAAFGVLFGVQRLQYLNVGICGVAGWITYLLMTRCAGASMIEATFVATLVVVIVSRFMAVRQQCPVTVFEICGIFPLIPGAGIYWTTYFLVIKEYGRALSTGMAALGATAAIVLGIILITSLPGKIFKIVKKTAS